MKYPSFISLLTLSLLIMISTNTVLAQEKESHYKASFAYNDKVFDMSGEATYVKFPLMYSFYFEESEYVRCGIHVMYLEGDIQIGQYEIGTEDNPKTGMTCVRKDEEVSERITSTSGEFVVTEINDGIVSGFYDIKMVGGITNIEYNLKGEYVSSIMSR